MSRCPAFPAVLVALCGLALPVAAQEPALAQEPASARTLRLDHGLVVDLPADWVPEDQDDEDGRFDASNLRRVRVECVSEDCARTQESCTFVLRKEPVEGADDAARLAGLYASALSRYARIRAVLKHTSPGATIRSPLAGAALGPRDWWIVETQAASRFKSGLFAETVIGGWYLGAICKTCETDETRHVTARAILSGLRRAGPGGGS